MTNEVTTARDIASALAARHPSTEWAFALEVASCTGAMMNMKRSDPLLCKRYIDAFAMHLFPSRKHERIAYEIKVSRSDWLAECKDGHKHVQAYMLCHRMYVVTPPGVVLKQDWLDYPHMSPLGVLELRDRGLTQTAYATRHEAWPMPEGFIAAFLRASAKMAAAAPMTPAEYGALLDEEAAG